MHIMGILVFTVSATLIYDMTQSVPSLTNAFGYNNFFARTLQCKRVHLRSCN